MFSTNRDQKLYLLDILKEITNNYNTIPWSKIAKMRDMYGVDDKVLWDTLDKDFKLFKQVILQIIEDTKS